MVWPSLSGKSRRARGLDADTWVPKCESHYFWYQHKPTVPTFVITLYVGGKGGLEILQRGSNCLKIQKAGLIPVHLPFTAMNSLRSPFCG